MWKPRVMAWLACAVVAVALGGCVELDGQRVSWYYDSAKDELLILLHYDGIHDSPSNNMPKGAEQLPEFVRRGDVMFWDWPFYVEREVFRKLAEDASAAPAEREVAKAILACKTEVVGHYREPDGKLGAAQLITIPQAKAFVGKLNALISHAILTTTPDASYARTFGRMQEAAKENHAWLTLEGHALRFVTPVDPGEWEVLRGRFVEEFTQDVAKTANSGDKEDQWAYRLTLGLAASTPLSYVDRGNEVEVVLGRTKTPTTMRLPLREAYEPSLEKVLQDSVKTNLDEKLAAALLGEGGAASAPVEAVLRFGPPEERVRALLAAVEGGEPARRRAAAAKLVEWAKEWNQGHLPTAPTELDPAAPDLTAWKAWYAAAKRYPLQERTPEKPKESPPKKVEEVVPKAPAPAT